MARIERRRLRMETLELRQLPALTPVMLTDSGGVASSSGGSNPYGFTEVDGVTYFTTGQPGIFSGDLWRTDGSAAGTARVHAGFQQVGEMVNFNGMLYFSGSRSQSGSPLLYRSDGTSEGTRLVRQANNQPLSYSPSDFVEVDDVLYFLCRGSNGVELWRTDGSAAGTLLVRSIPGAGSFGSVLSVDMKLTNVAGTLFFKANDGVSGVELWKSDGTAVGTVQVKDIFPGAAGGLQSPIPNIEANDFVNVGGILYFGANDGTSGRELWRSDGTEAGTFRVRDLRPGQTSSDLDQFTEFNGALFFTSNSRLWKSDGTEAGTVELTTATNPQELTIANNSLFFISGTSSTALWKSDGTAAGTQGFQLRVGNNIGANPRELTTIGDELFLIANTVGPEIWRTNGLPDGTFWTGDVLPNTGTPQNLANAGGQLYFAATTPTGGGRELYRSDGTGLGTKFVKSLTSESTGSLPKGLANLNGSLFFQANDFTQAKLWTSDGTTVGTQPFTPSTPSSPTTILEATTVGNQVFFVASSTQSGRELWKSDGTAAGTSLVKDIAPGGASAFLAYTPMLNANGTLYFIANDPATGTEVWKSDGTVAGTTLVKDLTPGADSTFSQNMFASVNFTAIGEHVYFVAYVNGRSQVWRTDGTDDGTTQVADFQGAVSNLVTLGDSVYFAAWTVENGGALWRSVPTESGVTAVKAFAPWPENVPRGIRIHNGRTLGVAGELIYFFADDGPNGYELWKSDGTEAGTAIVYESQPFNSPSVSTTPPSFVAVGSTMYFVTSAAGYPNSLWKTDGTVDGTKQVVNFPVLDFSTGQPLQAIAVNEALFFVARAPAGYPGSAAGRELWRTDGDAVQLVVDLKAGTESSNIANLINVNGDLYFTADNGTHGEELWMLPQRSAIASGDYNLNGRVDGADFLAWQRGYGSAATPAGSGADGDGDGTIGAGDLDVWKSAVAPPTNAASLTALAAVSASSSSSSLESTAPAAADEALSINAGGAKPVDPPQPRRSLAESPTRERTSRFAARDAFFAIGDVSTMLAVEDDAAVNEPTRRRRR